MIIYEDHNIAHNSVHNVAHDTVHIMNFITLLLIVHGAHCTQGAVYTADTQRSDYEPVAFLGASSAFTSKCSHRFE